MLERTEKRRVNNRQQHAHNIQTTNTQTEARQREEKTNAFNMTPRIGNSEEQTYDLDHYNVKKHSNEYDECSTHQPGV